MPNRSCARLIGAALVVLAVTLTARAATDVMCAAPGRYRECRLGGQGRVVLVTDLSMGSCIEGITWGIRSVGVVWVDKGCQGLFRLVDADVQTVSGDRVVCESENGGHRVCPADTRFGVSLSRQLSKASCVEQVTWGYDLAAKQVWVDDGCRAEFILGPTAGSTRATQKLDGVVQCSSANGRRTECKADTSGGVQIIRMLSDNVCRYAKEWGYDNSKIWVSNGCSAEFAVRIAKQSVEKVTCLSLPNERYTCEADAQYGVALVRELGDVECVLDTTWGFDAKGIWVANGCRAEFVLGGFRLQPSAVPASASRMSCASEAAARNTCAVDGLRGVGLVQQTSEQPCILNRTWGYDAAGIWVSNGCGAEFAVLRMQ